MSGAPSTGSTVPGNAAQIGACAPLRRRGGLSASIEGMPTTITDLGLAKDGALFSISPILSSRRRLTVGRYSKLGLLKAPNIRARSRTTPI